MDILRGIWYVLTGLLNPKSSGNYHFKKKTYTEASHGIIHRVEYFFPPPPPNEVLRQRGIVL